MGYMGRDVEVVSLNPNQQLVVACDSCGGAGSKECDMVKVSPYIVGRFTTRVALLEVVSTGATPQLLTVTVASEPDPTAAGILEGVNDELRSLELPKLPMAISTEKNLPTKQTGIGITVVGVCAPQRLRIATSRPGDDLYCLGIPKVGSEVTSCDDPDIIQWKNVRDLINIDGVHDLIPVGSRGLLGEAKLLASQLCAVFKREPDVQIDLEKSAGPSTCLIFSCSSECSLPDFHQTPIFRIGKLEK